MSRKIAGTILGLILFYVGFKAVYVITILIASQVLTKTEETVANVDAAGNILGLVVGAYLFNKAYKHYSRQKPQTETKIAK